MSFFAGANNLEAASYSPTIKKRPRNDSSQKLRQVLNYSSSVDKVCDMGMVVYIFIMSGSL